MDAHGLLRSQGWRGLGHTLHATDDSTGLARPLLLSRKDNRLGLGSQSVHSQAAATNQWWLDAFDQQLKGLTAGKAAPANTSTTTGITRLELLSGGRGAGKYRGAYGLYASFVRGDTIEGTVPSTATTSANSPTPSSSQDDVTVGASTPEEGTATPTEGCKLHKKRKREEEDDDAKKRRKSEKKERKEKKRIKRGKKEADIETSSGKKKDKKEGKSGNDDREDKLAAATHDKKDKKRKKKGDDADDTEGLSKEKTRGKDKTAKKGKKEKRKDETKAERKARREASRVSLGETKEQRRARRDMEKKRREEKRALKGAVKKANAEAKTA